LDNDFWLIAAVALVAAVASPLGGLLSILLPPSTLLLSIAVGFAGGILLGTMAFEMVPTALESLSVWAVVPALALGVALTYGLDFVVNRGRMAGEEADQKPAVDRYHRRHRPMGTTVTVLAAATAIEELIEGLTIGVGGSIGIGTAIVVGVAISIDNVSEALSIGTLTREENPEHYRGRTLMWTGIIGLSLLASALAGALLLKDLPQEALAFVLATGAGAMLYLTTTDLLPEAEAHQYQQSSALAVAAGVMMALVLSQVQG